MTTYSLQNKFTFTIFIIIDKMKALMT